MQQTFPAFPSSEQIQKIEVEALPCGYSRKRPFWVVTYGEVRGAVPDPDLKIKGGGGGGQGWSSRPSDKEGDGLHWEGSFKLKLLI